MKTIIQKHKKNLIAIGITIIIIWLIITLIKNIEAFREGFERGMG